MKRFWIGIVLFLLFGLPYLRPTAAQECVADDVACCAEGDPEPQWLIYSGALFLNRTGLPARSLLVDGTLPTPISLFDAQQFNQPLQPGWELAAHRRLGCNWPCSSVESRYFNVGGTPVSSPTITTVGGSGIPFADFPSGIFTVDTTSTFTYNSRLQSGEMNLRHATFENITFLAGVRYLNFTDRVFLNQTTATPAFTQQELKGINDLVGAQLGVDAVLSRHGRFVFDSVLKAGIYNNHAGNHIGLATNLGAVNRNSGTSTDRTAFVGEAGLNLTVNVTDRLSLRGGYQLLWIDGVAFGSEQAIINSADFTTAVTAINSNGALFYHGAVAGMQYAW